MKKLEEMGMSIGDFALDLIDSGDVDSQPSTSEADPSMPDISKVEISENLIESLTGVQKKETTDKPTKEPVKESEVDLSELSVLIEELKTVIGSLKTLTEQVNEMTTVGSLGTNMSGKSKVVLPKKQTGRDKFNRAVNRLKSKRK